MLRKNRGAIVKCMYLTGLAVSLLFAAEYPFSDNVSDSNVTKQQWLKFGSTEMGTSGGVMTVTNPAGVSDQVGLVYHTFVNKTPTFTMSCTITRPADSIMAGIWLCLNIPTSAGSSLSGYLVEIQKGFIAIMKQPATGVGVQIFGWEYHSHLTDTIKISKQGNVINVFCNGVYINSSTDPTPLPAGNLGLFVWGKYTALFDNIQFTDQFTPAGYPTCFTDNFDNSALSDAWIPDPDASFTENTSALTVAATSNAFCKLRVALADSFASRTIVSWQSGDSVPYYGFLLFGQDTSDTVRMALFCISGNQTCAAFVLGKSFYPIPISQIHGKYHTKDTLDVCKKHGSAFYTLSVNGFPVDSLKDTAVKFTAVGAGIYCGRGATIAVDYFHIGPTLGDCLVTAISRNTRILGKKVAPSRSLHGYVFDPLGRIRRVDGFGSASYRTFAPGLYLTPESRKGILFLKACP